MNIYLQEDFKMSEHAPRHHEVNEQYESTAENNADLNNEAEHRHHEDLRENAEKNKEQIEHYAERANENALSAEKIRHKTSQEHSQEDNEPAIINNELKEIAYQRILKRTRRHLPAYSKAMSKIIHQPAIDTVSEALSKSVGRPSGIIGGGLVALIGTSIYYYLTRQYGYNYNSFVFLALMVAGFVLGWAVEVLYKLFKSFNRK
jgi:translation elongation factor EF-G